MHYGETSLTCPRCGEDIFFQTEPTDDGLPDGGASWTMATMLDVEYQTACHCQFTPPEIERLEDHATFNVSAPGLAYLETAHPDYPR